MDLRLELVLVPVTDVDRARAFYVDKVGFTDPDGNTWVLQEVTRTGS